jgi:hypothetical protein
MAKDIGADSTEAFADIRMTSDNGFILIWHHVLLGNFYKTEASKGDRDYWIVKLNESGKFEWDKNVVIVLTKPNLSYKPKMEVMLPLAGHSRICQEIKQKKKVEGKIFGC